MKRFALLAMTSLFVTLSGFAQPLPTPEEFAGFPIGSDGNLVRWERIVEYLQLADQASDRIITQEIGKTTLGNPFLLVTISDPSNLARLDQIRAAQRRVAFPADLSEKDAADLARNSPAVLLITLNIHSTEIGSSQMALELIHDLVTDESSELEKILKNVVFLLVPSMNPDGQIMVVDWYNRTKGTENEGASMPWLYHHYVGHDNNRDAFMLTQKESRLLTRILYQEWFPQVFLDEHQMGSSGARIFVPPWTNPINPNVDPVIWGENGLLGFAMFSALQDAEKEGVIYDTNYTSWWQGGFVMEAWWHNIAGLLTEVASVRVASPIVQEMAKLGVPPARREESREELQRRLAEDPTAPLPPPQDVMPRNNYPRPWLGGTWTLRDIVDYELIVTHALLKAVADNRSTLITNQVRMGRRAIAKGEEEDPYAFIFPPHQHDQRRVTHLLELLHFAGVEVHQAEAPFEARGKTFPEGTFVVLMAQPFRAYAKDILEIQRHPDPAKYPPGSMREQPYDVTGWTLPLQMGVEAIRAPGAFQAELRKLDSIVFPAGTVRGDKSARILIRSEPNQVANALNRFQGSGARVSWLSSQASIGGETFPAGSLLVEGADPGTSEAMVRELGLTGQFVGSDQSLEALPLKQSRVGLYQPWTGSMDEGWTRWLLEQYEIPYTTLHNDDIRSGDLDSYDAIIFPGDRDKRQIVEGVSYKTTPEEYRGGIGEEGLKKLEMFVRGGGTLILMDRSTTLAVESWPIPLRNALSGLSRQEFSCPGSLLRIQVDPLHPVAYGMPEEATAFFSDSEAFDYAPGFSTSDVRVIARYPSANPLQSGWISGDQHLRNRIAAAEIRYHQGNIVLIGFQPQFRAQSHNTFKLLFNAIHWAGADR